MAVNTTTTQPTIGAADAIIAKIPAQYRCDPYEVSPSGDPYWADRRNVEALNRAIASAEEGPVTVINSKEDLEKLFAL